MIIFLYGEDSYRSREKLREIVGQYQEVHKGGLNLRFFDCGGGRLDISTVKDEARQASIFKDKKCFVLTNAFAGSRTKEQLSEWSKELADSDDIILIYEEGKIPANSALLKALQKCAKCQEFNLFSGIKLKNWIKAEFEKYNAKADMGVIEKLINYVGNDLWRMSNEIKKLASFKKGRLVKNEDIDLLIKPKIESDIFKTIDEIAQKNKKEALKLLQRHLEKGESPLYLLTMVNYQFRNLLVVKDLIERRNSFDGILKKSGLHPFVAQKTYFLAQKFTLSELKKTYQRIFQVDLDIKTGRIEPETALELLVAEM